jgi:hypothetical protein
VDVDGSTSIATAGLGRGAQLIMKLLGVASAAAPAAGDVGTMYFKSWINQCGGVVAANGVALDIERKPVVCYLLYPIIVRHCCTHMICKCNNRS